MKILVPTDLSAPARIALQYAVNLALKMNAELVLLNVVFIDAPPRAGLKVSHIEQSMMENAKQDCQALVASISSENKELKNVNFGVVKGFPVERMVAEFAEENKVDFIVMGTKGASGIKKIFIGSNTSAVINKSKIPVISVPEFSEFKEPKSIVYASDFKDIDAELSKLLPFAKLFDATINILHVIPTSISQKTKGQALLVELIKKTEYKKLTLQYLENESISEGIEDFVGIFKADMLALFTHELSFFEKLFGQGVTRALSFHNWLPMLTFKK